MRVNHTRAKRQHECTTDELKPRHAHSINRHFLKQDEDFLQRLDIAFGTFCVKLNLPSFKCPRRN